MSGFNLDSSSSLNIVGRNAGVEEGGGEPVINGWGVIVQMWKTLNRVNPTGG